MGLRGPAGKKKVLFVATREGEMSPVASSLPAVTPTALKWRFAGFGVAPVQRRKSN